MEESYQVSARRFRPRSFMEVIGQEHVVNSLKNSLKNDSVGHAFLFCGPRGVGKTTCARILARAINCENIKEKGEPCERCNTCEKLKERNLGGIFELDAASNNSVENIRNVIEQIRYIPQSFKYNVYIIDEVHMLSGAAFNAFLKTLEEPPKHVVFILATTEKSKVLPTILSRCQIFDFKPISIVDIVKNLKEIAIQRKIDAEEEALYIIAEKADGGMRDALSIFDTIININLNQKITVSSVCENINICDVATYIKILEYCSNKNLSAAIEEYNNVINSGFSSTSFLVDFMKHLRNLLLLKNVSGAKKFMKKSDNIVKKLQEQSERMSNDFLKLAMKSCLQCDVNLKNSSDRDILVEILIFSLASEGINPFLERKVSNDTTKTSDKAINNKKKHTPEETTSTIDALKPTSMVKIPKVENLHNKKNIIEEETLSHARVVENVNIEHILNDFENFLKKSRRMADVVLLATDKKIDSSKIVFQTNDDFKVSSIKKLAPEIIDFIQKKYGIKDYPLVFDFKSSDQKNSIVEKEVFSQEQIEKKYPLVKEVVDKWVLT